MSETVDLLVHGGDVLTVDEAGTLVRDGAVAVRAGEILAVGPAQELRTRYAAAEDIDAEGCLVLPGLVNTHTHLAMTLLRGRADDVTLQRFLERMLKWEAELLSPKNVAAAVRVAVAESVRAGVTSALDMYWFHEAAERAARESGWRLHTGPTFMDVPDPADGIAYEDRLAWARRDLADRAHRPGTRPVLFAHSTYTLSPGQLLDIAALAREFGALLHLHAAENATEVATVEVRHGKRPVELLDSLGLLGPDVLLAHAVDLTGPEIAALARTGTSVAHCPVSNLKLGCGIAPVPRLLSAGVTVGLGTDGAVSSNTLDVLGALRQAALVHKAGGDPTAVGAEQAVRMATIEGARALGLGDHLGSLEAGKRADLIVLDLGRPHLCPPHDPWSLLAYAAHAPDVRDTVVDGRILMRGRTLTSLDEAAALAELGALA
ncbi:N-ethylammeline chlorohydrolase [Streptomyces avermitilis]|uniref:N-ethylammeline chlorohydrolase n=2 Tax=Streptomyces avermitilis TaxID=33903 RepID=Q828L7_STRAW|nr:MULTISPECIES: amidohydrolase [Streptomyces]KUN53796.1 N-ethylammeline chlorohydrolase [Streptomyces avermitilis]MYT02194.1 amidohydrolase family protein [Streptomyces sp. SID5469]OOV27212.1 N-ethylammeline chlorohydrolase [Streptomyces avermitilis]BAC74363.1 putative N-ethylammeline chlorohydrolase [Streptomyces avermitilis MA-4680 = NBRC 14893]BBJ54919.1 5-methylthioadenosine/S-adenosylhomocysteine deaminase [Streptomyces avermitilis]